MGKIALIVLGCILGIITIGSIIGDTITFADREYRKGRRLSAVLLVLFGLWMLALIARFLIRAEW